MSGDGKDPNVVIVGTGIIRPCERHRFSLPATPTLKFRFQFKSAILLHVSRDKRIWTPAVGSVRLYRPDGSDRF